MTIIELADWAMYLGFAAGGLFVVAVVVSLWAGAPDAEEPTADDLRAADAVQINLQDLPLPRRAAAATDPTTPRDQWPKALRRRGNTYATISNREVWASVILAASASLDLRAAA
jgi:hypothetical protein